MRDSFSGFYGVSETTIGEVFKADNTVFIFDTNILLTLYRCEEETRNQFLNIWRKVKDQCWFPHHVCLEYQRNRLNVIRTSRDSLNAIPEKIKKPSINSGRILRVNLTIKLFLVIVNLARRSALSLKK